MSIYLEYIYSPVGQAFQTISDRFLSRQVSWGPSAARDFQVAPEIFVWVQVRMLDIYRVVLKTLCLWLRA